jgi:WD40 repeat protein
MIFSWNFDDNYLNTEEISCVDYSPDSKYLAASSGTQLKVWNAKSYDEIKGFSQINHSGSIL